MTCAIDVNGVSFEYENFSLQNIYMELHVGEQKAIVGPNGSGKTTLFKIIMGLLEPKEGEVFVYDRMVNPENLWEMRQEVGFLFQNPDDQLFAPTVWEDVAFGPRNLGLSEDEVARRVDWALDTVGMCDFINRPVNQMSHGQAKRVALAGIIAMRPSILILDEPFTGLDFEMVTNMAEIVQDLREEGLSILFTTHNRFFIENWTDSMAVLDKGRIIFDGSPQEALSSPDLVDKIGNWEQLRRRIRASRTAQH
ncbi:MAG: ABC transporter ATP-binding protein [Candidatus Thorarchaeota archaeon]|nr:MAG: ABC transporter ATP-binding protein [Candidatus Thorarchaeota archaeon]